MLTERPRTNVERAGRRAATAAVSSKPSALIPAMAAAAGATTLGGPGPCRGAQGLRARSPESQRRGDSRSCFELRQEPRGRCPSSTTGPGWGSALSPCQGSGHTRPPRRGLRRGRAPVAGVTSLAFENGLCQDHHPPAGCTRPACYGRRCCRWPRACREGCRCGFSAAGQGVWAGAVSPQSLSLTPHSTFVWSPPGGGAGGPPLRVSATGRNPELGREPSGPPLDLSASVLLSEARAALPRGWAEAPAMTGRLPGLAWGRIPAPWL